MIINNINLQLPTNSKQQNASYNKKVTTQKPVDASDISVTAKMKSQLYGLKQVLRNINTAQSFIAIADGYIETSGSVIKKIKNLSMQATSNTVTKHDRQNMQVQVSALVDEVDRIASQAQFNRYNILTGDFSKRNPKASMWFHIGPNMNTRERVYVATMTAQSFNLKQGWKLNVNLSSVIGAKKALNTIDYALKKVSKQRADLEGYSKRFKSAAESAIKTIESINKHYDIDENKNETKQLIQMIRQKLDIN